MSVHLCVQVWFSGLFPKGYFTLQACFVLLSEYIWGGWGGGTLQILQVLLLKALLLVFMPPLNV